MRTVRSRRLAPDCAAAVPPRVVGRVDLDGLVVGRPGEPRRQPLGPTQERGYDCWVLRDPCDNEFCVLDVNFPDLLDQRPPWTDQQSAQSPLKGDWRHSDRSRTSCLRGSTEEERGSRHDPSRFLRSGWRSGPEARQEVGRRPPAGPARRPGRCRWLPGGPTRQGHPPGAPFTQRRIEDRLDPFVDQPDLPERSTQVCWDGSLKDSHTPLASADGSGGAESNTARLVPSRALNSGNSGSENAVDSRPLQHQTTSLRLWQFDAW
jgi:hypothetical protein